MVVVVVVVVVVMIYDNDVGDNNEDEDEKKSPGSWELSYQIALAVSWRLPENISKISFRNIVEISFIPTFQV